MGVLKLRASFGGGFQVLSKNFDSKSTVLDLINDNWKDGFVNPLLQEEVYKEQELSLGIQNFTAEEMEVLAMKLSKMELEYLNLDYNHLKIEDIRILLSHLSHSKINCLNLNDNRLCNEGEELTLDLSNSSIKDLRLDSLDIGKNGGKLTLNLKDSFLKELDLTRNKIGLNKSMLSLDLTRSQLEELNLSYNPLSGEVVQELILNLKNSQVERLVCTQNTLNKESIMVLLSGLKHTTIKKMTLTENFIKTDVSTDDLSDGEGSTIENHAINKDPMHIDISDSSIEYLDLSYSFNEKNVADIVFNFERSPLKHLIISNKQSVKSWDSLGKALKNSSVESLQIKMGIIESAEEVSAIANSLCQTPLRKLTLEVYSMEHSDVMRLFEKLKDTQITELDFHIRVINNDIIDMFATNLGNVTTLRFGTDMLTKDNLENFFKRLKNTNITTVEIACGLIYGVSKGCLEKYLRDSKVIKVFEAPEYGETEPRVWWERNKTLEESQGDDSEEDQECSKWSDDETSEEDSDDSLEESSLDETEESQEVLEKYLKIGFKESSQIMERTMKELKEYHRFLETILREPLEKSDQFKGLKEIHQLEEELLEKRFEKSHVAIGKSLEKGLKKSQKILERHDEEADLKILSSALQETTLSFFNSLSQQKGKELQSELDSTAKNSI